MNNPKEYRELGPDDFRQLGDEIKNRFTGQWHPVESFIGEPVRGDIVRRPITPAQGGEGESDLETTGIPYFTMKRSEWDALGESGQKAMADVVKAVVADSRQGNEPLCEQCGESSGAHHMGGQEHTFRPSGANPATGVRRYSSVEELIANESSEEFRHFWALFKDCESLRAENERLKKELSASGTNPATEDDDSERTDFILANLRHPIWQKAALQDIQSLRAENERLKEHLDLMVDEFKRIKALGPGTEIEALCERAITNTRQNVPLIFQRDSLQENLTITKAETTRLLNKALSAERALKEASDQLAAERKKREEADTIFRSIIKSCVHPDTAVRALLVPLQAIRDFLAQTDAAYGVGRESAEPANPSDRWGGESKSPPSEPEKESFARAEAGLEQGESLMLYIRDLKARLSQAERERDEAREERDRAVEIITALRNDNRRLEGWQREADTLKARVAELERTEKAHMASMNELSRFTTALEKKQAERIEVLEKGLANIYDFPVANEPMGAALAMQDIARASLRQALGEKEGG